MEFLKLFNEDGREPSMEDSGGIRACLQELKNRDLEFKIKVDKAHTIPYTVQIDQFQPEGVLLAFQRPLPHELAKGALFHGNFQMEGHNFQFFNKFLGRSAYLRYLFSWPERVSKLERRKAPRQPFRPREKAYVSLRDGGVPGIGVAGPLLNLSRHGVAIRVDRVIRLGDGFRLSVNNTHFPPGKFFDSLRLQDLPGVPRLDLKGFVVHATNKGGVLLLGLSFQEMDGEPIRQLEDCLKLRGRLQQTKAPIISEPVVQGSKKAGVLRAAAVEVATSWDSSEVLNENPPEADDLSEFAGQDPLRILLRRTLPLIIAAPNPEGAEALAKWLRGRGYLNVRQSAAQTHPVEAIVLDSRADLIPTKSLVAVPAPEVWERDLVPQLEQRAFERM